MYLVKIRYHDVTDKNVLFRQDQIFLMEGTSQTDNSLLVKAISLYVIFDSRLEGNLRQVGLLLEG